MKISVKITRQENATFFGCKIDDVVAVEFEEYVAAVVASEIGNAAPEACKAQAIAARTFAVGRGVLKGKTISDSSSTAQAYRAPRYNKNQYPNCINAANTTSGVILTYKGAVISAVYCAANGGRTVSAEKQWGSVRAYLVEQTDVWDAAAGKKKSGHGVGMSQAGACYAANNGIKFREILEFYYPHTILTNNYGMTDEEDSVVLREGSRGMEVASLQSKLNELGFNCGNIDGIYGTKTAAAVSRFQKAYELSMTGEATSAVLTVIDSALVCASYRAELAALSKELKTIEDKIKQITI